MARSDENLSAILTPLLRGVESGLQRVQERREPERLMKFQQNVDAITQARKRLKLAEDANAMAQEQFEDKQRKEEAEGKARDALVAKHPALAPIFEAEAAGLSGTAISAVAKATAPAGPEGPDVSGALSGIIEAIDASNLDAATKGMAKANARSQAATGKTPSIGSVMFTLQSTGPSAKVSAAIKQTKERHDFVGGLISRGVTGLKDLTPQDRVRFVNLKLRPEAVFQKSADPIKDIMGLMGTMSDREKLVEVPIGDEVFHRPMKTLAWERFAQAALFYVNAHKETLTAAEIDTITEQVQFLQNEAQQ